MRGLLQGLGEGTKECFLVLRYELCLKYLIIIKWLWLEKYFNFGLLYLCLELLVCVNICFELSKELLISLNRFLYKVSITCCYLPNEYPNLCFICFLKDGVVLVHCNAGVSRAAAVVIGFLMNSERLSFARAFALVKNARPAACPNPGFMEQLHKYQEQNIKANGSINDHD